MNIRRIPPVTTVIIGINIAVYVLMMFLPPYIYNLGVLSVPALEQGRIWTLVTSMFMHGGLAHIACNMISLFYLGTMSERVFGKVRYLLLYFASGIIGGLVYVAVNFATGDPTGAVGASGAIFGLFGAYGLLLFRERKEATVFIAPTRTSEVTSYLMFLGFNIVFGLTAGGIANEAHIGGLVSGFIIAAIFYPMLVKERRGN